jgi:hypothetical protein
MAQLPITYSLIGCCGTRDAVELGREPLPKPVHYIARTKIQSLVSTPSPINPDDINIGTAFERRTIIEDHRKTAMEILAGIDHPIVIDLIAERWPLGDTGSGLVTSTVWFTRAGLDKRQGFKLVPNDTELAAGGPYATAVRKFSARLPQQPVLVHRVFWASHDTAGEPLDDLEITERNNRWLDRAYTLLEEALGDRAVASVEVDASLRVANPDHRWSLGPFHYVDEYYTELSDRIRKALS